MPARRDMLRLGLAAAAVGLALPVRARQAPPAPSGGFISRKLNAPVPGGVAVLSLGDAAIAPEASYRDRRVLVVREAGRQWIAVVGIPLAVKPGPQEITLRDAAGAKLSKSTRATGLRELRAEGVTPADVRRRIGL